MSRRHCRHGASHACQLGGGTPCPSEFLVLSQPCGWHCPPAVEAVCRLEPTTVPRTDPTTSCNCRQDPSSDGKNSDFIAYSTEERVSDCVSVDCGRPTPANAHDVPALRRPTRNQRNALGRWRAARRYADTDSSEQLALISRTRRTACPLGEGGTRTQPYATNADATQPTQHRYAYSTSSAEHRTPRTRPLAYPSPRAGPGATA